MSLPVRGAWIEIGTTLRSVESGTSLPVRGAWIEILLKLPFPFGFMSLPVRGAWIEIKTARLCIKTVYNVAPRAGSVD